MIVRTPRHCGYSYIDGQWASGRYHKAMSSITSNGRFLLDSYIMGRYIHSRL
jgi:hypothetical protein